jgi:hypothetical protein
VKRDPLPALVACVFLLLGGVVTFHHELWRDEVQAWLLARDSASVPELLANMRYEGHPALWHLLLLPLTRIFATPVAMQGLHLLLATATVYLFARWAPFSRLQKILFCFGYFPFYEYGIIARNYGLCLLLLTAFGCLYARRERWFPLLGLVLALLCHAHVLGLMLVGVILLGLIAERLATASAGDAPRLAALPFYGGCALVVIGMTTALLQAMPPRDAASVIPESPPEALYEHLHRTTRILVGAHVPWSWNWNSPWVLGDRPRALKLLIYTGVPFYLLLVATALRRHLPALFLLVGGTGTLLAFFHFKFSGSARHHGFLFLCLVFAVWLQRADSLAAGKARPAPEVSRWGGILGASLTLLFALHTLAAATLSVTEWRRPFSRAADVTEYLQRHGHDRSLLVGHRDFIASALLGSSAQRQIYYPQSRRWGSYVVWNRARTATVTEVELVAAARELPRKEGQRVVLVLDRPLDTGDGLPAGVTFLAAFTGAITDENFHLYQVD